jgi:uncharacterized protein
MGEPQSVGRVEAIFRYPIKSMAGEQLADAQIGWHGVDGDRRFALRRVEERGGMPWLTASKLPALLQFTPIGLPPTHVRTPDGRELAIDGPELIAEIERRYGKPVQLMRLDRGIFDEGAISVIAESTIHELGTAVGYDLGVRRFRPNILIRTDAPRGFEDNDWVGSVLAFGDDGPRISIQLRDERCAMLNLDADTAESDPRIMKAAVRMNDNKAGVYGTVIRCGRIAVGQRVYGTSL